MANDLASLLLRSGYSGDHGFRGDVDPETDVGGVFDLGLNQTPGEAFALSRRTPYWRDIDAAHKDMGLPPPKPAGGLDWNMPQSSDASHLYKHHQKELASGGVQNTNGSISTVYGMTAPDESGRHRMLPLVWDQKVRSPDEGYARARAEGLWRFPGSFSPTRTLHNYMNDPEQHPRMEQDVRDYLGRR